MSRCRLPSDVSVLRCGAEGNWCPTFRDNVVVSSSGSERPRRAFARRSTYCFYVRLDVLEYITLNNRKPPTAMIRFVVDFWKDRVRIGKYGKG